MINIYVLAFEHCWSMNVAMVSDFFTIIERLQKHHKQPLGFRCQIISYDGNSVCSASGKSVEVDAALTSTTQPDLIIIPPIDGDKLNDEISGSVEILEWISKQNTEKTPIASITTGAALLAKAQLLKGKVVATHWAFLKQLRNAHPETNFVSNKSFCYVDNIYSTGTFNGCMDVLLHFISQAKGEHFAQQCAAHSLLSSPELLPPTLLNKRNHQDARILRVQDWIEENFNKNITVLSMANIFAFSERNLKRRFKLATGVSPIKYLQQSRLEKAKGLLLASELSISEIAYAVGYENCSFFIRLFKRNLGVTPNQWRQQ